jgi:hypothetical protein
MWCSEATDINLLNKTRLINQNIEYKFSVGSMCDWHISWYYYWEYDLLSLSLYSSSIGRMYLWNENKVSFIYKINY